MLVKAIRVYVWFYPVLIKRFGKNLGLTSLVMAIIRVYCQYVNSEHYVNAVSRVVIDCS